MNTIKLQMPNGNEKDVVVPGALKKINELKQHLKTELSLVNNFKLLVGGQRVLEGSDINWTATYAIHEDQGGCDPFATQKQIGLTQPLIGSPAGPLPIAIKPLVQGPPLGPLLGSPMGPPLGQGMGPPLGQGMGTPLVQHLGQPMGPPMGPPMGTPMGLQTGAAPFTSPYVGAPIPMMSPCAPGMPSGYLFSPITPPSGAATTNTTHLDSELKNLQEQNQDLEMKYESSKQSLFVKDKELENLREMIKQMQQKEDNHLNELYQARRSEREKCYKEFDQERNQINNLKMEIEKLKDEKFQLVQSFNKNQSVGKDFDVYQESKQEISRLKDEHQREIQQLKETLKRKDEQIQFYAENKKGIEQILQLQQTIAQREKQIDQQDKSNQLLLREFNTLKTEFKHLQEVAQTDLKCLNEYKSRVEMQEEKIRKLENEVRYKLEEINGLNSVKSQLQESLKKAESALAQVEDPRLALLKISFGQIQEETEKQEKKRKEAQQKEREADERKRVEAIKKKQQERQDRKGAEKEVREQAKRIYGVIDICFLVDVTGSMDPFRDQAIRCIENALSFIKEKTGRECRWSAVAYQDYDEQIKYAGKYRQLNFTKNGQEVYDFLKGIKCEGGEDAAEDLQGGLEQMIKLEWKAKYKMAMIITDAPCHGAKWNGGKVNDNYKKEDMTETLDMLIQKHILIVSVNLKAETQFMFNQIKQHYTSRNASLYYYELDASNKDINSLNKDFANLLTRAAENITYTNSSESKVSQIQQQIGQYEEQQPQEEQQQQQLRDKIEGCKGAMEAMFEKNRNPINFDKEVPVQDLEFLVWKVELTPGKTLGQINPSKDEAKSYFKIEKEGNWQCIRSVTPFAAGMVKEVYLMKQKSTPDKLYAIKIQKGTKGYEQQEDALLELRTHLFAKQCLKEFMDELEKKTTGQPYPKLQYTEVLLLQDVSTKRFWIAERFFEGEFRKFTNNFGYISNDDDIVTMLAIAFSYYTYAKSEFNSQICDIQGIGNYFTDPAVNTSNDVGIEPTDMGIEGMGQFMVMFEERKRKCRDILDKLDMYPED